MRKVTVIWYDGDQNVCTQGHLLVGGQFVDILGRALLVDVEVIALIEGHVKVRMVHPDDMGTSRQWEW